MKYPSICSHLCALAVLLLSASRAWAQVPQAHPVATAEPDKTVFIDDAIFGGVTVWATSTDVNNDPITHWGWSVISKPVGSLIDFYPNNYSQGAYVAVTMVGVYELSVIACDQFGCGLQDPFTLTVVNNLPPVITLTADATRGVAPLTVHFDASQTYDPEGGALTYSWYFGFIPVPGAVTNPDTATPSLMLPFPGLYDIELRVSDDYNKSSIEFLAIDVLSATNIAPTINPVATPHTGTVPLTVQFAANAFDADSTAPLDHQWDFGDPGSGVSNTSINPNVTHTYNTAGSYVAWITVSDGIDSVNQSITIVANNPVVPNPVVPNPVVPNPVVPNPVVPNPVIPNPVVPNPVVPNPVIPNPVVPNPVVPNPVVPNPVVPNPVVPNPVVPNPVVPNPVIPNPVVPNPVVPNPVVPNPVVPNPVVPNPVVPNPVVPNPVVPNPVVPNPVLPRLDVSVKSAKLDLKELGVKSKVKINVDFTPTTPGPDEVIYLALNNREIFAAPFSSFVSAGSDDEDDNEDEDGDDDDSNPNKFKLKMGRVKVEIDIAKGRIEAKHKYMNLGGFNPNGDIVIELRIGERVAVDAFALRGDDHKFEYKR